MCIGVPAKVLAIDGRVADVEVWGERRQVRLDWIDRAVVPGDYVLSQLGQAVRRIPDEEVAATLALYDELLAELERRDAASRPADPGGE